MALSSGSKGFLVLLVLIVALTGTALWRLRAPMEPVPAEGQRVTVPIRQGMGVSEIGDLLERQDLIRSSVAFTILARLQGTVIQAGTYEVPRGSGLNDVLDVLAAGPPPPPAFTVTIPEGLTVEQTLGRIAAADGSPFTTDDLRAALAGIAVPEWVPIGSMPANAQPFEGLLFPNTYEFRLDASPRDVLTRLVRETDEVMASIIRASSGLEPYDTLILASLVEREARLEEERPRISAVIHNRLEEGQRLEIDATVLYALGEQKDRVLRSDLEIDSPWNTYRNSGLPPTPISGVGEASIRAAAHPADEDFLYYVVEPDTGRHRFSRTFAEHQQAIADIRRQSG
ncbi:MAG: endolytic transglycosylase MltG [Egibacteraceae bacterium]